MDTRFSCATDLTFHMDGKNHSRQSFIEHDLPFKKRFEPLCANKLNSSSNSTLDMVMELSC